MHSSVVSNSQRPDNVNPNGSPINQGNSSAFYISPQSSAIQNESLFDQYARKNVIPKPSGNAEE